MKYKVYTSRSKTAMFDDAYDAVRWAAMEVYTPFHEYRAKVDELIATGSTIWRYGFNWVRIDRVD